MNSIGENLKKLRIDNNWSQDKIAELFNIKRQTWASYEKDKSVPDANILIKLSEITNKSVDEILGLEENKKFNITNFSKIQDELKDNLSSSKWIRIKNLPNNRPKNNMLNIFNKKYDIELYNPLSLLEENNRVYLEFLNCYSDDVETRNNNYYEFIKKYGFLGLNLNQSKIKYFVKDYLSIYNNEENQDFNFWKELYKGSMTSIINPYEEVDDELNENISKWLSSYNNEDVYFEDINNYFTYYNEILDILYENIPFEKPSEDINVLIYSRQKELKTTYTYGSLLGLMKLEILSDMQNGIYARKCYKCGEYFLTTDMFDTICSNCKK